MAEKICKKITSANKIALTARKQGIKDTRISFMNYMFSRTLQRRTASCQFIMEDMLMTEYIV